MSVQLDQLLQKSVMCHVRTLIILALDVEQLVLLTCQRALGMEPVAQRIQLKGQLPLPLPLLLLLQELVDQLQVVPVLVLPVQVLQVPEQPVRVLQVPEQPVRVLLAPEQPVRVLLEQVDLGVQEDPVVRVEVEVAVGLVDPEAAVGLVDPEAVEDLGDPEVVEDLGDPEVVAAAVVRGEAADQEVRVAQIIRIIRLEILQVAPALGRLHSHLLAHPLGPRHNLPESLRLDLLQHLQESHQHSLPESLRLDLLQHLQESHQHSLLRALRQFPRSAHQKSHLEFLPICHRRNLPRLRQKFHRRNLPRHRQKFHRRNLPRHRLKSLPRHLPKSRHEGHLALRSAR